MHRRARRWALFIQSAALLLLAAPLVAVTRAQPDQRAIHDLNTNIARPGTATCPLVAPLLPNGPDKNLRPAPELLWCPFTGPPAPEATVPARPPDPEPTPSVTTLVAPAAPSYAVIATVPAPAAAAIPLPTARMSPTAPPEEPHRPDPVPTVAVATAAVARPEKAAVIVDAMPASFVSSATVEESIQATAPASSIPLVDTAPVAKATTTTTTAVTVEIAVPTWVPNLPVSRLPTAFATHLTRRAGTCPAPALPSDAGMVPRPYGAAPLADGVPGTKRPVTKDHDPPADFVIIPQRPTTRPITPPRKPAIYVDPAAQRDSDSTAGTSTNPTTPGGAAAPMTDAPTGSTSNKSDPLTPAPVSAKELKDLFNYASIDCAAVIRSTNPEAKGATSILTENKDSYLLSPCRVGKHSVRHVVVELCDEILVNTLVLANYELFSSTFRHVRVWVNSVYPPTDAKPWRVLADLDAANSRSLQVFQVTKPVAWARYMKLEFLSQYGAQYFCPVSLLRVHGRTMLEEYKLQQTKAAKQAAAAVASTAAGTAGAGAVEAEAGRTAAVLPSEGRNATAGSKDKDTTSAAPVRVKPPQLPDPSTVRISVPDSIWDAAGNRAPDTLPQSDVGGAAIDQPATSSVVQDGLRQNAWSAEPEIPLADVGLVQHPEHVPFLPPKLQLSDLVDTARPAAPSKIVIGTGGSPTSVPVPEPNNVGAADPAMPAPGADASATRSIPPRSIPSLPPPPMEDDQEPPPDDEGIYQTIMKRFALVEANHKLLLQYMEEYAQGINEVIRTNDENQSEHFMRSMMQLSQHVVARLAAIKEELSSLVYGHRATSRRFETATTRSVKTLQNQVRALEDRTTSLLRWMIVLGLVLVSALVAPWVKVGLTTLLSASIATSVAAGESVANFPSAKDTARRRVNGYASESVASRARSPVTARSAGTSSEDLNASTKRRSSQLRARSRRRGHLAIVMEPSRRLAQSLPSPTRIAPGLLSVPADPSADEVEELEWVPDPAAADSLPSSQNSTWKSSDELPPPSSSPPHVMAEDLRKTHSVPDLVVAAATSAAAAAAGSSPVPSAPGTPLRAKRASGDSNEGGAVVPVMTLTAAANRLDTSSTASSTLSTTSSAAPTTATLVNSHQGMPVDGAPSSTVAVGNLAETRAVVMAAIESVLESASVATAGGPDASVGSIESTTPPPPPAPLLLAAVEMAAPVVPVS
ncbi:hypothetical protein AMAG_01174 [Allomyces macrogynus ATCC 38327]|uniref:SUN domain-containing protein n=1 Tax=Allomyces macrogynus (strain ATCC 38327) TaxID=578462 RepID=A0A0L0RYW9_ALLM3|nr:hypothetical protein AMAG_01174 [Allomyces macrogynus ATCC 38327]|eukprot:KNE55261.1 hypothetical protein AMAG_01174 [Allomyces macrogynus ATCC 38327]